MTLVASYSLNGLEYDIEGYLVHSAVRAADGAKFLAKAPGEEFPPVSEVLRLDHELRLLEGKQQFIPTVLQPIQRVDLDRTSYLILEYFEGRPLAAQRLSGLSLPDFLSLGCDVSRALAACHERGVTHLRLTPSAVLWSRDSAAVKLTHFCYGMRVGSDGVSGKHSQTLTLCSAPEQTGRLDLDVDHRADLYALGSIFYYLLSGTYPFDAEGHHDLVHALLARSPTPVTTLCPNLPQALGDVVSRLLAKHPGERYQTATQVADDLESLRAEAAHAASGGTRPSTRPALMVPRLCGRAAEVIALSNGAADAARGKMHVACVSGAAGTGKSRLLTELRHVLQAGRHLVLCGKFEQYQRSRPYSAIMVALHQLIDRLLGESEDQLQYWKNRFARLDRPLKAVLLEHVPRLRFLLDEHPEAPRLGPTENENRFRNAIRALTEVLCDAVHPLALLLDDFQWADDASAELLRHLFVSTEQPYLFLLLSERGDDPDTTETVRSVLTSLSSAPGARRIALANLTRGETFDLCGASLHPCSNIDELAEFVFAHSNGNPLFALELIKSLERTGGIRWLRAGLRDHSWRFFPNEAISAPASDDVLRLILNRMVSMDASCKGVLKVAACFGGAIYESVLLAVTDLPSTAVDQALLTLCKDGILVKERPAQYSRHAPPPTALVSYRFVHDRIKQAARSLCCEADVADFDYRIGFCMWNDASTANEIFAIAEHLNRVHARLTAEERQRLAQLNIEAAASSKAAVAYGAAITLYRHALELVSPDDTEGDAGKTFLIRQQLAESHYLSSDFASAEALFEQLALDVRNPERRIEVYRTRMVLYLHLQRYGEAIDVGLAALRLLGWKLPANPSLLTLAVNSLTLMWKLARLPIARLVGRADKTTARDRSILDIAILLWTPSFWINQPLNGLIGLKLGHLTLRLGNTPESAMAWACYGVFNHLVLRRYGRGIEFGNVAARIAKELPSPFIAGRVDFITLTFFGPFQRSNRANVEEYDIAFAGCIQHGEHVFAGCCIDGISTSVPISGFRLPEARRRLDACGEMAARIGGTGSATLVTLVRNWCDSLCGGIDRARVNIPELEHDAYKAFYNLLRMSVLCLWGDDVEALSIGATLRGNPIVQSNPLHAAFYDMMTIVCTCRRLSNTHRKVKRVPRRMKGNLHRLERFAQLQAANFGPNLHLARAEVARLCGNHQAAIEAYRQAIAQAAATDHYFVHGLACERLAGLYDTLGDGRRHEEHLRVAAYSYRRWGAVAKVEQLMAAHPSFALTTQVDGAATKDALVGTLDTEAVMRASYAIAEETRSDRLADKLLRVLTTTAGAERGFLIKERDDALWIIAGWDLKEKNRSVDSAALEGTPQLAEGVVRFVARSCEPLYLVEAFADPSFRDDPYISQHRPRSILCVPLMVRGSLLAVMYLENGVNADVFGERQRQLVTMLGHQAAIALSNADYHKLQIAALQAKVNPHFLYNALSTVAELIVVDPQKAENAVLKLARLYRYMISVSSDLTVGLDEEIEITRSYLMLERLRYGEKLEYDISVIGDAACVRVPALIVQPLAENSVKHGIAPMVSGGAVKISVIVEEAKCSIHIKDNGLGWGHGKQGTGVGLKTVRERLALFYGSDYSISIDKTDGVGVTIIVPVGSSIGAKASRDLPRMANNGR